MKKLIKILLSLLIIVLIIAIILISQNKENNVKIGALLALTGPAAFFGEDELLAIKMAVEEQNKEGGIKGRLIELIVEDTAFDTKQTISGLMKLKEIDNVKAIIGPTWDQPGVYDVAEEKQILMISPDNSMAVELDKSYDYFFSTFYPVDGETHALLSFMNYAKYTKVAIIKDDNIYPTLMANIFQEEVKRYNIKVIEEFSLSANDPDFRTPLTKIKELNIDTIYITNADEGNRMLILKQAFELNLNKPIFFTSGVEQEEFLKKVQSFIDQLSVYYVRPTTKYVMEFNRKFRERYGRNPISPATSNAYDATKIIIEALEKESEKEIELKEYLQENTFTSETFGRLTFDKKGHVAPQNLTYEVRTINSKGFQTVKTINF